MSAARETDRDEVMEVRPAAWGGVLVPPANPTVEPELARCVDSKIALFAARFPVMPGTALEQHLRDGAGERPVAGTRASGIAAETVEPPDGLAVEAQAGGEAEPPSVHRAEADPASPPGGQGLADGTRRVN